MTSAIFAFSAFFTVLSPFRFYRIVFLLLCNMSSSRSSYFCGRQGRDTA